MNKNHSSFDEIMPESEVFKKLPTLILGILFCLTFRDYLPKRHMFISTCRQDCLIYKESQRQSFAPARKIH